MEDGNRMMMSHIAIPTVIRNIQVISQVCSEWGSDAAPDPPTTSTSCGFLFRHGHHILRAHK